MRHFLALALLGACTPNYAQDFVGEWTVSSGTSTDTCPPPNPSGERQHVPGDTLITIADGQDSLISIKMAFLTASDPVGLACEYTASAALRLAQFQAKSCAIGRGRHDIIEGELELTTSGALAVRYKGVTGESVFCSRFESSIYVRK